MRKVTLTLLVFLGGISIASAQSGASATTPEKKVVESKKQVIVKKDQQPAMIKSAKLQKLERMPKKQEAVIEEKKTNQK